MEHTTNSVAETGDKVVEHELRVVWRRSCMALLEEFS